MKNLFISTLLVLTFQVSAQVYNLGSGSATNNSTLPTDTGYIYDDGGVSGYYSSNQDIAVTILANGTDEIRVTFGAFNLESNDSVYVYDGSSTSSNQVPGSPFTGSYSPVSILSTSGSITIRFKSNGSGTDAGFEIAYSNVSQSKKGTKILTWENSSFGSQTIVSHSTTASGPPATVTDQLVGCPTAGSSDTFDMSLSITESNGNIYDGIRSGTNGSYGQPYLTIWMDNYDNWASPNTPYSPGNSVDIEFSFEHPIKLVDFRVDDIDAGNAAIAPSGSNAWQDEVSFFAIGVAGDSVPVSVRALKAGRIDISGNTATGKWDAGVNNDLDPDSLRSMIEASVNVPITKLIIRYTAGADELYPAQQAIRIGSFTVGCPVLLDLSGRVFNDYNGLEDGSVNGLGIGLPSGTQLYANLIDSASNRVAKVNTIGATGVYSFTEVSGELAYYVQVTTAMGVVGELAPTSILPTNWVAVGEKLGVGAGSDGTIDQKLLVQVETVNINNINFSIEQRPDSDNKSFTLSPAPYHTEIRVLKTTSGLGPLSGEDPEEGSFGSGNTYQITDTNGLNGNVLFYDINVDNQFDTSERLVSGDSIKNYNPSLLKIKFNGLGSVSFSFKYCSIDSARRMDLTPASYSVGWSSPVPVEFVSVEAQVHGTKDAIITWATASEMNNEYFEVQRRYEYESDFTVLGKVDGQGNSNAYTEYKFIDLKNQWLSPVVYYRIVQVDFDGNSDASYVVPVTKQSELELMVYPNPAHEETRLTILGDEEILSLQVLDIFGKNITGSVPMENRNGVYILDVQGLRNGAYYVQINTEIQRVMHKLLVSHR
ncbi:MAG: hypothetical protein COA58_13810 [Bacteroidetes bacterium]|nr:MAG: hypothetical protein COA58_13810 [Bacteroidota bacterium]